MNLDFSLSVNDWVGYFRRLLDIIASFLEYIGIKLFADPETEDEGADAPDAE